MIEQTTKYLEDGLNVSSVVLEIPEDEIFKYKATHGPINNVVLALILSLISLSLVVYFSEKMKNPKLSLSYSFRVASDLFWFFLQIGLEKIPQSTVAKYLLLVWFTSISFVIIELASVLVTENSVTVFMKMDKLEDILPFLEVGEKIKTLQNSVEYLFLEKMSFKDKMFEELMNKIKEDKDNLLSPLEGVLESLYEDIGRRQTVFVTNSMFFEIAVTDFFSLFDSSKVLHYSAEEIHTEIMCYLLSRNLSISLISDINFRLMVIFDTKPFGMSYGFSYFSHYAKRYAWSPTVEVDEQPLTFHDFVGNLVILLGFSLVAFVLCFMELFGCRSVAPKWWTMNHRRHARPLQVVRRDLAESYFKL